MTLLLIPAIWILGLALVAGLCMAARRGDSQPEAACDAHGVNLRASVDSRQGRRATAAEHGEFAGAGRAAA